MATKKNETPDASDTSIREWRSAVLRNRAVNEADADELESHLREQIADLQKAGLTADEAFLVGVRRLGEVDAVTAEYAREHSDRLWKQLAMPKPDDASRRPVVTMLLFAVLGAVALQTARVIASWTGYLEPWFIRDFGFFVLIPLIAYFVVQRRIPWQRYLPIAGILVVLIAALTLFPFQPLGETQVFGANGAGPTSLIVALHLPVVLWFLVGAAYVAGDIRSSTKRMDFIRFTGEWVIYFALIALGGAVLIGLTIAVLTPIAPDVVEPVVDWVLPTGFAGAVVVAAWLVEAKKSIIENLAPVLTAIFTPLFAAMLLVAAVAYAISGIGRGFDRDLVAVFDLLLMVVLGLVVYGISARSVSTTGPLMDTLRLVAVVAAIVLDVLVLVAMLTRVGEYGFTANRVAALGLNVLLLGNLAVTAWHTLRLLTGRAPAIRLERWQTGYLPVFAGWVVLMVLAIPPLFAFA